MGVLPDKMDKVYPDVVAAVPPEENPARSCPDLHSKNREPTDVCFLTIFAVFFVVVFAFIGYCMYFGDVARILKGYDHCGSVCGVKPIDVSTNVIMKKCYDERAGKFGRYRTVVYDDNTKLKRSICAESCDPKDEIFFNRCISHKKSASKMTELKEYLVEVSEDFEIYWQELMYLCILSLALSLFVVILFRFCVGFIVWIILVGVEMACIGASLALWALWIRRHHDDEIYDDERKLWLHLGFAVGATIIAVIVGLIIFIMRKKIDLVIQLFEEAGKAIADMAALQLIPIMTFLAFAATISSWIYSCLWIASSGRLTQRHVNDFYYKKDGWMMVAGLLSTLGMLWMIQFIIGCQHMIVAGSVSKWYFTRDKRHLSSPVAESVYNLTRFHLGSVALGSFIIVIIQILKFIVQILQGVLKKDTTNPCLGCILKACLCACNCCLHILEWIVTTFSVNAYVVVAMYGHSFFKAGRLAFTRIVANPLTFVAINSIGDFVLLLAKVMVVVIVEATAMYLLKDKGIQHLWVFNALVGLFSLCISHLFVTIYEMTIDTIFICFCEDSEINDGVSKPYYMSRGLMEYVENSKKALEVHDKKKISEKQRGEEMVTVN